MNISPRALWDRIESSLWFLPAIGVVLSAVLAEGLLWLGSAIDAGELLPFLFSGGVDGARGMLQAIATSSITVAGVAFSITIIALQLTSSQFSPRVLASFLGDRINQLVLGTLIGTFTYSLLVLRTIRSADDDNVAFVPELAVSGGFALAVASVAMLIAFIHHISSGIQVTSIVDRIARETVGTIERLWCAEDEGSSERPAWSPADEPTEVSAPSSGYLQDIATGQLVKAARALGATVQVELKPGDWVQGRVPALSAWTEQPAEHAELETLADHLTVGNRRTMTTDVAFGIRQLVDIGVKALSPGVNDPTTAENALHRITQILVEAGLRSEPRGIWKDEDGVVRLVWAQTQFEDLVELGFEQLIHDGALRPSMAATIVGSLETLITSLPTARHRPLLEQARTLLDETGELRPERTRQRVRTRLEKLVDGLPDAKIGR